MPIIFQCRSTSSSFSHNLGLTQSHDERHHLAAQTLEYISTTIFPALELLRAEKGEDQEYREAREAVIELLSFVCIPFVRSCTLHSWAVSFLHHQAGKSNDAEVRKKLVIYANQIKNSWNKMEPGGIHHSPRATRRVRATVPNRPMTIWPKILVGSLVLYCLVHFLLKSHLASEVIEGWKQAPVEQPTPLSEKLTARGDAPPSTEPATKAEVIGAAPAAPGDFCRYTDDKGVVHIVNDPAKVPARYRTRMEVTPSSGSGSATKVMCRGDQVLVPVTLRYRGREVQATLLLDTGASVTTINEDVASRLEVDHAGARLTPSRVADGRTVASYTFAIDSVSVGSQGLRGVNVSILPGAGGNGYDGLLGMNFLKEFRYHVDYQRSVIEWGS